MSSVRKSPRIASPANAPNLGLTAQGLDPHLQQEAFDGTAPLQPPQIHQQAPTVEGSRGSAHGRPGMREQMSQFRTMQPQAKGKLRVKQYDPSRRSYFARNDDVSDGKETSKPSVRNAVARKPNVGKVEDRHNRASNAEEMPNEREKTPKTFTASAVKPTQTLPTRASSTRSTPTKAEEFEPRRLGVVVDSAVERAYELGNESLGHAIRLIYQDSLSDPPLYRLLVAVLRQKQSPEEADEFQRLIKMAKKRIKEQQKQTKSPPKTAKPKTPAATDSPIEVSKPKPAAKSPVRRTRQSIARTDSALANTNHIQSAIPQPQLNGKMAASENKKPEEPPPKRVKRSRSLSSSIASDISSLSTLSSRWGDIRILLSEEEEEDDDDDGVQVAGRKGNLAQPPKGNLMTKGPPKKPYGSLAGPKLGKESAKEEAEDKEREAKKRKMVRTEFNDYNVDNSSLRGKPQPRPERIITDTAFPNLSSASHSSRGTKRDHDEMQSPASSIQADLLVPPPPEARRISRSRAATPNIPRTRGTVDRGKARVKESPMKKKNGVVAGIAPRTTRAKDGAAGTEQTTDDEGENVDFCSACGDQGKLLCCDGCVRSFHFKCLDPPMDEDHPPEGRWFCQVCQFKRQDDARCRLARGLFAMLEHNFSKQTPVAFSLPNRIREYYEGVGTGEDGEYEEVSAVKTRNSRVPGYDEIQKHDNLRLKDSKNQVILCFRCGLSSLGKREIISCDYCGLHWHLDCLNPPLANAPYRDPQNRAKYRWMCPAHADSMLTTIGLCGRLYKTRRPKNAEIVDTQLRRGFRSNGLVEIELDPSDDEMNIDETPKIYRLTETNIRLDFNDRLRKDWEDKKAKKAYAERLAQETAKGNTRVVKQSQKAFDARSLIEQDAMLGLCELAGQSSDFAFEPDHIKELVVTLLSEAPDNVVALLDEKTSNNTAQMRLSIPPSPPDSDANPKQEKTTEVKQLLLLQELIRRRLMERGHVE